MPRRGPGPKKSQNFCWRVDDDWERSKRKQEFLRSLVGDKVRYIGWGREHGTQNKRPHLQGYVQFFNRQTIANAHKILGLEFVKGTPSHWCDFQRGTLDEATKYTEKDGDFEEHGQLIKKGQRRDIDHVWALCNKPETKLYDLIEANPSLYSRCHAGIEKMWHAAQIKRALTIPMEKKRFIVHYGAARAGKSTWVREKWPAADVYRKNPSHGWFQRYNGEPVIWLEEFDGKIERAELCMLIDPGLYTAQVKGSDVPVLAHTVVVTTNIPPNQWYPCASSVEKDAVLKRIDELHHWTGPYDSVTGRAEVVREV